VYVGTTNLNKLAHSSSQKMLRSKRVVKSKEKTSKLIKPEGKPVKYSKIDLSLI